MLDMHPWTYEHLCNTFALHYMHPVFHEIIHVAAMFESVIINVLNIHSVVMFIHIIPFKFTCCGILITEMFIN